MFRDYLEAKPHYLDLMAIFSDYSKLERKTKYGLHHLFRRNLYRLSLILITIEWVLILMFSNGQAVQKTFGFITSIFKLIRECRLF